MDMEIDFEKLDGWASLSDRQQRFVVAYLKSGNGNAAVREAGYSPHRADVTAAKLKKDVKVSAVIAAARKELFKSRIPSLEEAMATLGDIMRGRVGNFITPGGEIDLGKVRDAGPEVASVDRTVGDEVSSSKIKLRDPVAAIAQLAKLAGWNEKSPEAVTAGTVNYFFNFSRGAVNGH